MALNHQIDAIQRRLVVVYKSCLDLRIRFRRRDPNIWNPAAGAKVIRTTIEQ